MTPPRRPRVGLALGSGSARGWAHVGVIRALEQAGIRPDLVCGTSVGSLVGAAYAAGELDRFEQWLLGMRMKDVIGFMDVSLTGGLIKGGRVMEFFRHNFVDRPIEKLAMPFAAVATALYTGAEVWLRDGSTVEAVRASIALPGLFTPVLRDGTILVDGGLVNPVPVSLARAMGAEVVIAVDLSSDILGRHKTSSPRVAEPGSIISEWMHKLQKNLGGIIPAHNPEEPVLPSLPDVLFSGIEIMQVRIARSRMAGEPPDFIVSPRLAHLHLLDFHRANEAIEEGKRAVDAILHNLRGLDNHLS
ncbi:MAG: patatin-like phospholipase RssA [Nitrospiria bacterium]